MKRALSVAFATILTLVLGAGYGLVVHRPVVAEQVAGAEMAVFVDWCPLDTWTGCDGGPTRPY